MFYRFQYWDYTSNKTEYGDVMDSYYSVTDSNWETKYRIGLSYYSFPNTLYLILCIYLIIYLFFLDRTS